MLLIILSIPSYPVAGMNFNPCELVPRNFINIIRVSLAFLTIESNLGIPREILSLTHQHILHTVTLYGFPNLTTFVTIKKISLSSLFFFVLNLDE